MRKILLIILGTVTLLGSCKSVDKHVQVEVPELHWMKELIGFELPLNTPEKDIEAILASAGFSEIFITDTNLIPEKIQEMLSEKEFLKNPDKFSPVRFITSNIQYSRLTMQIKINTTVAYVENLLLENGYIFNMNIESPMKIGYRTIHYKKRIFPKLSYFKFHKRISITYLEDKEKNMNQTLIIYFSDDELIYKFA